MVAIKKIKVALFFAFCVPVMLFAETIGVFYDTTVGQSKFAAGDVKTALESKSFTVEMLDLSQLSSAYANKKVVVALSSNTAVTTVLTAQGGTVATGLGEQAYALRTTTQPQMSYWVLGGDANGAMYGGLQIAENVKFNQFMGTYDNQESPYILKRGIKLNLGMDKRSPSYSGDNGTSFQNSVPNTWDMTFWTAWFDAMARNRYNVFSLWTDHPFTAMTKMTDYPNVALQDVQGYNGFSKTITIDQKIAFWQQVMAYAHSRGFAFYLVNWNIFTYGATGQYGIDNNFTTAATIAYSRKCMSTLLETYPDLDGFGVTAGENMGSATDAQKEQWLWNTFGQGMVDYASAHPQRKLNFIHRWHQTGLSDILNNFRPLINLSNVTFDMSYKYSQAHMYSTAVPTWIVNDNIASQLTSNNLKTWYTVRNDDMYFLHWGDPAFARAYLNGMPGKGSYFRGFYIGSDGNSPTRTFFSKNSVTQGGLEVDRLWYTQMLWGRLSYNPSTPDDVFKKYMALKYPSVSSDNLFTAWSKASSCIPKVTELLQATFLLDYDWWPEACFSGNGFRTVNNFAGANPGAGSTLCSIAKTASNSCGSAKTSYQLADEIEADAQSALGTVNGMSASANTELGINLNNIKAISYLSIYYAYKIRGATYVKAGQTANAKTAMGTAYCNWMNYANLMDAMYTGMNMQRVNNLANWHAQDAAVLADYTGLGGTGTSSCPTTGVEVVPTKKKQEIEVGSLSSKAISFSLPDNNVYSLMIFNCIGGKVAEINQVQGKKGFNKVALGIKLKSGVYFVRLKSMDMLYVKRIEVVNP